ncbi:MAG: insulinase family protein [Firmicutes bacterium]|nr:insulinase family protein [Bacillota bacterium]
MERVKTPTGHELLTGFLPNGLHYAILPRPGFVKKYAILATKYGSLDSRFEVPGEGVVDVPDGIAHFLEHKLFEEADGNVFDRFAQWGASVNAFTSYTQTAYLFSTVDHMQEALDELIRFVTHPYLTEENVEKEKGIIVQELRMYEDHPDRRLHKNLLNALYHKNPIRLDIGGTPESVSRITVEWLMKCYRTFYQPANMVLVVVGDVDPQMVLDVAGQHFRGSDSARVGKRVYPEEPPEVNQNWVEDQLSISRPRCAVGIKSAPISDGWESLKLHLTMNIVLRLIAARSSPHYERLYNSGLIDDSFGASFNSTPYYCHAVFTSQTDDPRRFAGEIKGIIQETQNGPISEADVERLKRLLYGGYLASFDSLEYVANNYVSHYFNGTPYFKFLNILQSITVDDVQKAAVTYLDLDRSAVSILWPHGEEEK